MLPFPGSFRREGSASLASAAAIGVEVRIFSHTSGNWVQGTIVHPVYLGQVTVEYELNADSSEDDSSSRETEHDPQWAG